MQPSTRIAPPASAPSGSWSPPAFKGLADDELKGKLLRRQQASEGEGKHCFVRPGKDELLPTAAADEAAAEASEEAAAENAAPAPAPTTAAAAAAAEGEGEDELPRRHREGGPDVSEWSCEGVESATTATGPATGSSSATSSSRGGAAGERGAAQASTPAGSHPPSPRGEGQHRSEDAPHEEARTEEDFEGCLDEWLLELVNHLPRERVIALEQYIRSLEQERVTATASLKKVRQSHLELERERRQSQGASFSFGTLLLMLLALPLLFLLASPYLNSLNLPSPVLANLAARSELALNGALSGGVAGLCEAITSETASDLRSAPPSIASLVSDAEPRSCPHWEDYERLRTEHGAMKQQLDRLQFDIDDAMSKGQDMVCWQV